VFFYNFCVEYKEPLKSGDKVIVTKHNGKVNLEEGLMSGEIVGFDVRTGKFEILLPNGRHHFAFPDCVARVPTTTNEKKKGGNSGTKNKSTTALDNLEEGGIRKPTNKGNMAAPPLTMNIIKLQPVLIEAPPSSSKTSGGSSSSSNLPRPITSATERESRTINKKEVPASSSSSSSSNQRLVKLQTILNSENPKANYAASLGIPFTTDKEPTSHVNKNNKNSTKKSIVTAPQQAVALDKRSESLERPAPEREPRPVVAVMPPSSSSSSSKKTVAVPNASIKKSSSSVTTTNEDNNNNSISMMKVKTTKPSAAATQDQQNLSTAAQIIRSRIQSERNATRMVVL
jgi:hypothetical protein